MQNQIILNTVSRHLKVRIYQVKFSYKDRTYWTMLYMKTSSLAMQEKSCCDHFGQYSDQNDQNLPYLLELKQTTVSGNGMLVSTFHSYGGFQEITEKHCVEPDIEQMCSIKMVKFQQVYSNWYRYLYLQHQIIMFQGMFHIFFIACPKVVVFGLHYQNYNLLAFSNKVAVTQIII